MMEQSEAYKRGVEVRKALYGDEGVARADRWRKLSPALDDFVMESIWGGLMSRPELSRRDREIASVAALTCLGRQRQLESHVKAALAVGLTKDEILEVILQMAAMAGVPACLDGMQSAEKVFRERGLLED
jgi:alkylhydroperoxidase/carboxymuconolactone decarboxylase family protein YurZ